MDIERSTLKVFLSDIGTSIVGLLAIAFFAKRLGPVELGSFFLFQSVVLFLSTFVDVGVDGAVAKRISEGQSPDVVLSSALLVKLLPWALFSALVITFQEWTNQYIGAEVAPFVVLALLLRVFAGILLGALRGEMKVGKTGPITAANQLVWAVSGIAFVLNGFGTIGLVYALLLGETTKVVWAWVETSTSFGIPSIAHAKSQLDFSKYNLLSTVSSLFYNWTDLLIIGFFLGQGAVGVYEVAWRISTVTMLFTGAVSRAIFPQISKWDAESSFEEIETLVRTALLDSLLLVIPAFFGVALYAKEILTYVGGSEYAVGALVLVVLTSEKLFQSANSVFARTLSGMDKPHLSGKAAVVSISLNAVLNLVLVVAFGIIGAAFATTAAILVTTGLTAYYLSNVIDIRFPTREIGWCVLAAATMSGALLTVNALVPITTLLRLSGAITFGAILYFALLLPNRAIRGRLNGYLNTTGL